MCKWNDEVEAHWFPCVSYVFVFSFFTLYFVWPSYFCVRNGLYVFFRFKRAPENKKVPERKISTFSHVTCTIVWKVHCITWELFNKAVMKRVAWSALTLLVAVSLSWWGSPWGSWWCGGSLAPVGGWRVQGTARHRHEPPSPSEWSWQEIKWKNEQHNCQNKSCHEDLKMTLNSCCVTLIRSFHMRWKQDSLAEGEVRLVAGCHATTFSAASFSRVTGRRGGCHGFLETRCHATTTSCSHLIFRAVVFISSLLHPGPLLGRARWITFLLRENKEADWADEEQMYQRTNYLEGNNCCKMLFDSKRP